MNAEIQRELAALERHGLLSPQAVVIWAATHEKSALHGYFEWNNRKAGEAHRLHQASELILRVKVTVQTPDKKLIRVVSKYEPQNDSFKAVPKIMPESRIRALTLRSALRDLKKLRLKYSDVGELSALFEQIDSAVDTHTTVSTVRRQAG